MSTPKDPGRAAASPALTSLPRLEDIPQAPGGGYDADRVRDAFDAFRRHAAQLQAQLRVLQAAGRTRQRRADRPRGPHGRPAPDPRRGRVRRHARARRAERRPPTQLARTEEEVRRRQRELQEREAEIERYRQESERQRAEMLNAARNEARELLANAQPRRDPGGSRGRGARDPAARAGAPSGDRAHERRPRRGRADARVGARPGRRDHGPRPAGRRAVPRLRPVSANPRSHASPSRSSGPPTTSPGAGRQPGSMPSTKPDTSAAQRTDPGAALIAQARRRARVAQGAARRRRRARRAEALARREPAGVRAAIRRRGDLPRRRRARCRVRRPRVDRDRRS